MFTSKHIKHARLLLRGVDKFIHFKRDILKPEKLAEVQRLREEFAIALKQRDKERMEALAVKLNEVCDKAAPPPEDAGLRDWVDSLVTCAVIVFAIRAFFIQPFKIPTGSMQPTLNGIIATRMEAGQNKPNALVQVWDVIARGRNHVKVTSPVDGFLLSVSQRSVGVFLNYTTLKFKSEAGKETSVTAWAPSRQLIGDWRPFEAQDAQGIGGGRFFDGLWIEADQVAKRMIHVNDRGVVTVSRPLPVKKNQVLAAGTVDSGDMVLVDKVSYNFRRPKRGEVFVFNTRGIAGIEARIDPREGSQHYIKRLTGVPGDNLDIKTHDLIVNGAPAKERGIRRVVDERVEDLTKHAYHGYSGDGSLDWIPCKVEFPNRRPRGYFAMGDNSYNSYDSRYWGPVPEPNLVGPALLSLWPFTTGHWGLIK
ncbi:MAG: signal peptidase I [Verrucomicrobiales bacterium]